MHIGLRDKIKSVVGSNSPTMASDPLESDKQTLKGYSSLLHTTRKEVVDMQSLMKTLCNKGKTSADMRQALVDAYSIATDGQTKAIRHYDQTFIEAKASVEDRVRPILEKMLLEIDTQTDMVKKAESRLSNRDKHYAKLMSAKGDLESAKATGNKVDKFRQNFDDAERAFQQATSEAEVSLNNIMVVYQTNLEEMFAKLFSANELIFQYYFERAREVNDKFRNPTNYMH